MDEATKTHFETWIKRNLDYMTEENRNERVEKMLEIYNDDPEYWNRQDWNKLFNESSAYF